MVANDPRDGATFDPRGVVITIYKEDYYTCYKENMNALGLVVLENKIFFYVFPIISLWELSVVMETILPIRPGPKPNATFPSPH